MCKEEVGFRSGQNVRNVIAVAVDINDGFRSVKGDGAFGFGQCPVNQLKPKTAQSDEADKTDEKDQKDNFQCTGLKASNIIG